MKKLKNKDIVQHYLLNLFTILNVELSSLNIEESKKKEIVDLVNTASVIIANENIFSGETPGFFYQDISLNEIISITGTIFSDEIESKKINVLYPENDMFVRMDKYYFNEAFKYFFQRIIQESSKVSFSININDKILSIEHDGNFSFTINEGVLANLFKKDNVHNDEILFQLSLEIFKLLDIKISQEQNRVILNFK